jgi:integrase
VKRNATPSRDGVRSNSSRRHKYTKVLDNRKHPIRGLWRRNGKFLARITVEDESGKKEVRWVPLAAKSAAEAQDEFRTVMVERKENRLRHIGRSPAFAEYLDKTYLPLLAGSGKKPDTITTEKAHYKRWRAALGHLRLDKIRPSHIQEALNELRLKRSRSPRTCNLALVCLRHVLKAAKRDGYIKTLPSEDIAWQRTDQKKRRLYTLAEIDSICAAGFKRMFIEGRLANIDEANEAQSLKNAQQLSDYLRFLAYTGAREQEALRVRWADVDFEQKLVCIGHDADTKNREARHVDFNPALETHLQEMKKRRAPDSQWLFPSPQRGERDEPAKTFRESMKLARQAAKVSGFGFHDCRHHFISFAVMSGIDYMTIARWVGHKDGGVLIGKVYGHLSNEHAQAQAARLSFAPTILQEAAVG